jgi:hypothetical protein
MSTRAIARIYDDGGTTVLTTMYKHWDGYPEGFGADLTEFAAQFKLVNGIPVGSKERLANGMGCFAASMVKEFKQEAGDVYIYPADCGPCDAEYIYHVKPDGDKITVICEDIYGEDE